MDNYSNIKVTNSIFDDRWHGLVWDASIHKYTLTIDASRTSDIMLGFAPSKLYDMSKHNNRSCGWYLHLNDGTLYSQDGDRDKAYSSACKVGDIITCIYNASTSEIFYEKNGASLGVAYTNVKGEDIASAVELCHVGDSVTLSIA